MQKYSEYRPTGFDCRGLGLPDQQNWLVIPCIKTRDSSCLELSNFETALKELGGESDSVEVCNFGHWACGWFEIIVIDPLDAKVLAIAEQIESSLENYPVLDEEDFSEREYTAKVEYIASALPSELIGRCFCHACAAITHDQEQAYQVYDWLSDNNERALDVNIDVSSIQDEHIQDACFALGLYCPIELINYSDFTPNYITEYIVKHYRTNESKLLEILKCIEKLDESTAEDWLDSVELRRLQACYDCIVPANQLSLF